jgi:hypothetical protein
MKLSNDTLKLVNRLTQEKREKVNKIVRRHVAACYRNGFPPENLERVYIEAVELVNMEEIFPEAQVVEIRDWEPYRHYDQYVSPKAA